MPSNKNMRREERKKRGGEEAKRKSQDCCDTYTAHKQILLSVLARGTSEANIVVCGSCPTGHSRKNRSIYSHLHETLVTCEEIQVSLGFWIPRHAFRIPGTKFQSFFSEILELYSGFQIPGFRISQAQISRVSESGFPYVGVKTRFS